MQYIKKTCSEFIDETASKAPVPGGGSVSALVGALGASLGRMVASLTIGKKKYADVEEEMRALALEADALREELMALVQADIDVFEPLSKLYSMKTDTPEEKEKKEMLLEAALESACGVPLKIMESCGRAIELCRAFADKGSVLAVSDAGAGAAICKGAMQAASLNVYINTKSMRNRKRAAELEEECKQYLIKYVGFADEVFAAVENTLRK